MCRIFAIRNFEYREHRHLLEGFLQLARTGATLQGDPPGHTDGWGIGYYADDGRCIVHKSGGSLLDERDDYFTRLASAGTSPVLIAHLRKSAWPATTTAAHAHPFAYQNALFAHNGTVRDYKSLIKDITVPSSVPLEDALDTEIFFLHIMTNAASAGLAEGFRRSVRHIKEHNVFSSLTCVFSDGTDLYGYRDYQAHDDYYTLYQATHGRSSFLCSEQLPGQLSWRLLNRGELIVLQDF